MKRCGIVLIAFLLFLTASGCTKVSDKLTMGNYGGEAISWIVVDQKDGKYLVVSDKILDWKLMNETYGNVTWETSTLRTWLNDTFYNKAFSADEKKKIVESLVDDSTDKLFLLSKDETVKYNGVKNYRRLPYITEYGYKQMIQNVGGYHYSGEQINGFFRYWTRTNGASGDKFICKGGNDSAIEKIVCRGEDDPNKEINHSIIKITTEGGDMNDGAGVRPAMWITGK